LIRGSTAAAPPFRTIPEALWAASASGAAWLTFHHGKVQRTLSFAEVFALARGWAMALREAGVRGGDRVAVLQPNEAGFVGAFFGAQLLGAAPVPLAWPVVAAASGRYDTLAALVRASRPAVLAVPASFEAARDFGARLVCEPLEPGAAAIEVPTDSAQPAFLQFTSGTTGAPRGAVISHGAAVASAWVMGKGLRATTEDVGVSWLPLFHDMGLVGVLLCSLLYRFPIHVLSPAEFLLRPSRWLELLSQVKATITVGPNFGYELATRRGGEAERYQLSALRMALNGSEPVHRATLERFQQKYAASGLAAGAVVPVYGLAENTLGVCFSDPLAPQPDLEREGRAVPSVGRPLDGMEVALCGPGGAEVPDGEQGEITVRGPSLMSGYFENPEASAAALRDGWLYTGDLGVARGGCLYVTGREKDLVIKGGRKFHPYDIERVVADAVDAPPGGTAAFAVPNETAGTEDLVVVTELRRFRPAEEIEKLVRGKLLEELGVRPDRVKVVGAGALPRTSSGKVQRRACAERYGGAP
jgi:fatty-acyl-CoA synthase